jgi:hypothetical protein
MTSAAASARESFKAGADPVGWASAHQPNASNPVERRPAAYPGDSPSSSFARCVALGMDPPDWVNEGADLADAGELL